MKTQMTAPSIHLHALQTANPDLYADRSTAFNTLREHFPMSDSERDLYERLLLEGPVEGRYVGMDAFEDVRFTDQDSLINRFQQFAVPVGCKAARQALDDLQLPASDIAGVVVNTCTGYLCPGLSSYITEALGLRQDTKTFDLVGMGCGAALPNLECAAGVALRQPGAILLSISVEICSATLFMDEAPDLIVSNSIFGDGAAACVLSADNLPGKTSVARILDFETGIEPRFREHLRYRSEQGRLRNTLSKRVPAIGARVISRVQDRLLKRNNLNKADIDWWIVHPGGSAVLDAVRRTLDLSPSDLGTSYDILREYGNMSSPSVLFVLRRMLDNGQWKAGEKAAILTFGAGFTGFGALLELSGDTE